MLLKELQLSLKDCRKNIFLLSYSFFLEFVFFFFGFGFLVQPILDHALAFLNLAGARVAEKATLLSSGVSYLQLLFSHDVKIFTLKALLLFLIAAVVLFLVFCLFQSLIWRFVYGITVKKVSVSSYIKTFTRASFFWYFLFLMYHIITMFIILHATVGGVPVDQALANPFFLVILLVIFYFAFVNYAILPKTSLKKVWLAAKQFKAIFVYISFLICLVFINWSLVLISSFFAELAIIFGIALLFPFLFFARIFFMRVVRHA